MPAAPPSDIDTFIRDSQTLRARRRAAQAREPVMEIIGLVDPSGAGRSRWKGDPEWTFSANLIAWRLPGGPVQRTPVRLERPADDEAYAVLGPAFDPYDLVRIKVRMPPPEEDGVRHAFLETLVHTIVDDDELEAFAAALQAPVVVQDAQLGALTLDRSLSWFTGELAWRGGSVQVHLPAGPDDRPLMVPEARAVVAALADWEDRARQRIREDLLELFNDTWRDEESDPAPLSVEAFQARLSLSSFELGEGRGLTFWYDDGDLFAGHSIEVQGDLDEGFSSAGLAG